MTNDERKTNHSKSRRNSAVLRRICIALVTLLIMCFMLPTTMVIANEPEDAVRVGWVSHPGLQDYSNDVYSGYTYDYLTAVANYTGWTYEFVPGTLTEVLTELEAGRIDIVGGLIYSDERATKYDLSQNEYGKSYISLFTSLNSSLQPYDYDSFEGIRVGVTSNATVNIEKFRAFAIENGFTYVEVPYDNSTELDAAVMNGDVDAGMRGAYQSTEDTKILADFSPSSLYFAVTKGNTLVTVPLNRAMNQLAIDNPYLQTDLYRKYFSIKSVKLTDAELAIVDASKTAPISCGIVDNSAPLCYLNSTKGAYEGISVDMLNLISEKTGLKFEYVAVDTSVTTSSSSPKIVAGVQKMDSVTDSRGWYLSDALVNDTLVLVGKQGNDISVNPSSKTLALVKGFVITENYVSQYLSEYKVAEYADIEACMTAVASGKADAAVYFRSSISYLLQKPYFENLEIIPSYSDNIDLVVAAFDETNEALIDIINKGLLMISDEESRTITLNYTVMNPYQLTFGDMVYKFRVPLIIIVLLVLLVIATLIMVSVYRHRSAIKLRLAYENEKEALKSAENQPPLQSVPAKLPSRRVRLRAVLCCE